MRYLLYINICLLFISCVENIKIKTNDYPNIEIVDDLYKISGIESLKEVPLADYVVALMEDRKGGLWIGTIDKGLFRFHDNNLTNFTTENGLSSNTISSIAEDSSGNLWIGTHNGLSCFNGNSFKNYKSSEGLDNLRISDLLTDRSGKLWIATWDGVYTFLNGKIKPFLLPEPDVEKLWYQTTMNWVTQIFEDSNGNLWFSRDGYGICSWDKHGFMCYGKKQGLLSNNVQSISQDFEGNIWVGCRVVEYDNPNPDKRKGKGGLCVISDGTITVPKKFNALNDKNIYSLLFDDSNRIWIGASGTGLVTVEDDSVRIFSSTDRMDLTYSMGVQTIYKNSKGELLLGMSGGLFKFVDSKIAHVSKNSLIN